MDVGAAEPSSQRQKWPGPTLLFPPDGETSYPVGPSWPPIGADDFRPLVCDLDVVVELVIAQLRLVAYITAVWALAPKFKIQYGNDNLRVNYPELVTELPAIENGHILAPTKPGIGTTLLPEVRKREGATVRVSE